MILDCRTYSMCRSLLVAALVLALTALAARAQSVSITSPTTSTRVSGIVPIVYTSSFTPQYISLFVNGAAIARGPINAYSPLTWDTSRYYGTNTVVVQVSTYAGQVATSAPVRVTTSNTPNQVYVAQVFWNLGYGATPAEINRYAMLLNTGQPRAAVVANMMLTYRLRRYRVERAGVHAFFYPFTDELMRREVSLLNDSCGSQEAVEIDLASSDDYFNRLCQSSNVTFVEHLLRACGYYSMDPAKEQPYVDRLSAGEPRARIATEILTSDDARRTRIRTANLEVLRLNPADSFTNQWLTLMRAGNTDDALYAALLSSPQYLFNVINHAYVSGYDLR